MIWRSWRYFKSDWEFQLRLDMWILILVEQSMMDMWLLLGKALLEY